MLMTRFLFVAVVLVMLVLDGVGVWYAGLQSLPAAALIVNAAVLPLVLVIAYRLGQLTLVEKRRAAKAKAAQKKRPRLVRSDAA